MTLHLRNQNLNPIGNKYEITTVFEQPINHSPQEISWNNWSFQVSFGAVPSTAHTADSTANSSDCCGRSQGSEPEQAGVNKSSIFFSGLRLSSAFNDSCAPWCWPRQPFFLKRLNLAQEVRGRNPQPEFTLWLMSQALNVQILKDKYIKKSCVTSMQYAFASLMKIRWCRLFYLLWSFCYRGSLVKILLILNSCTRVLSLLH